MQISEQNPSVSTISLAEWRHRIEGEIDEFVTRSIDMTSRVASTHSMQPVDVKINADRALVMSYGHITLRFTEQDQEYDMISWGWWIHRAVHLESQQRWLLTAMRFIYNRDSIVPVAPGPKSVLDIELGPDTRPSCKYLEWTLTRRGYAISKTLVGTDQPDGVKVLRAQEDTWLFGGSSILLRNRTLS